MAQVTQVPMGHDADRVDVNKEVIHRLQDYLNNPDTEYSPSEIWHKDYKELRPWPFWTGTEREGNPGPLCIPHFLFLFPVSVNRSILISSVRETSGGDPCRIHRLPRRYALGYLRRRDSSSSYGPYRHPHSAIQGYSGTWETCKMGDFGDYEIKDGLIFEQESFREWLELMSQLQWPVR